MDTNVIKETKSGWNEVSDKVKFDFLEIIATRGLYKGKIMAITIAYLPNRFVESQDPKNSFDFQPIYRFTIQSIRDEFSMQKGIDTALARLKSLYKEIEQMYKKGIDNTKILKYEKETTNYQFLKFKELTQGDPEDVVKNIVRIKVISELKTLETPKFLKQSNICLISQWNASLFSRIMRIKEELDTLEVAVKEKNISMEGGVRLQNETLKLSMLNSLQVLKAGKQEFQQTT